MVSRPWTRWPKQRPAVKQLAGRPWGGPQISARREELTKQFGAVLFHSSARLPVMKPGRIATWMSW
jgi:hypothetical protein